MNKVILFSAENAERLTYIADLLLTKLLGLDVAYTTSKDVYLAENAIRINYSNEADLPGYQISPSSLLFEESLRPIGTQLGKEWGSIPTILLDAEQHFDVLAASFYLVSRYEEYLPFKKDAHSRFSAEQSCLMTLGLLQRPLVNEWARVLQKEIKKTAPSARFSPRKFAYLSTIDIDQAWKYRNKGFLRSIGGIIKDCLNRDWKAISQRISVLSNKSADPFYNFDWQDNQHTKHNVDVHYFVQVGNRGKFDKNTNIANRAFQSLIQRLDKRYKLGMHPSYQSNKNHDLVRQEHQALSHVVARDIDTSRQHFLMHKMPETYQRLCDLNITQDHTMGYSTHLGFRAGIAAPFQFFDLTSNSKTQLELIPFCCMDITPLHYLEQSPHEAVDTIKALLDCVHEVGGLFVSLWHNESLSEDGRWQSWRKVYSQMLEYATKLQNSHAE